MRVSSLFLGLAVASAGCAVVEETPRPTWKAPVVGGWRLTERPYGELSDPWTRAEDGLVAPDAPALYFEPVFRNDLPLAAASAPPEPGPFERCQHTLRLRYEGTALQGVGNWVETRLEIPGPGGIAHVVEIAGSHPGVEIADVRGGRALAGGLGRYLIGSGGVAHVRFTSRLVGRGGLEVRILGELGEAEAPAPPPSDNVFVTDPR